jgi:hypothetical protein
MVLRDRCRHPGEGGQCISFGSTGGLRKRATGPLPPRFFTCGGLSLRRFHTDARRGRCAIIGHVQLMGLFDDAVALGPGSNRDLRRPTSALRSMLPALVPYSCTRCAPNRELKARRDPSASRVEHTARPPRSANRQLKGDLTRPSMPSLDALARLNPMGLPRDRYRASARAARPRWRPLADAAWQPSPGHDGGRV